MSDASIPVAVEAERPSPEGGRSLYVRDPAGNGVGLAPPTRCGGLGLHLVRAARGAG